MAHKLEAESGPDEAVISEEESESKLLLNRRKYMMAGGAAIAALTVGATRTGATTQTTNDGKTYWTDFSEGAL